tara:strand:+ start:2883 stop:9590 length:6708 start_codon:yes stop_codon:yes gene_type:complete
MKKFDIKKWKEKQKKLFKESKLNEQNIDPGDVSSLAAPTADPSAQVASAPQQLSTAPGLAAHWQAQGFPGAGFGLYGGWLYQCDGGVYQEYLLTINPNGPGAQGSNAIGLDVQNALYTIYAGSPPNYWSGFNDAGDITPVDVIAYCINNPNATLASIKCKLALGAGANDNSANDPACGGLWFGEYEDNNPMSHNHRQVTPGTGTVGVITGTTPANSPLQGTYPNLIDAVYAHSPATGTVDQANQYAMNNCNGSSGACDSSHYLFGCMESLQGAANYSLLQNDPEVVDITAAGYDANDFSTWSWLSGGEGLSGGWLDGNTILGQGTAASNWLTAFTDPVNPVTNPVEGCDDGTGIPNATNYDCCTYIGCNDTTQTGLNTVPTNYGVHNSGTSTVNTNYTATSTPINLGQIQTLNSGFSFGCESTTTSGAPDSTNQSCCAYIGCPGIDPNYAGTGQATNISLIYNSGVSYHDINDPYTWYFGNSITPIAHPYAGTRIVGCDTAAMIADATGQTSPTGIPDPADYSCCWVDPFANQTIGCTDTDAINGDVNNDGCIDDSITDPNDPLFGVAQSNIYTCCTYSGCPDFTDQSGIWDYTDSNSYGFKYLNQVAGNGTSQGGFLVDPSHGGGLDFTTGTNPLSNPLKTLNGGKVIDDDGTGTNTQVCRLPNFGCANDLATNYDVNFEGCEGTGNRVGLYDNYTNPTVSTICCRFHGCPEPTADNYGPFNPSNVQYGNNTAAVTDTWGLISTTWTWLNGTPAVFGCDSSAPYNDPVNNNTDCCSITGCTDDTATNYICNGADWAIWCDAQGGNVTGNVINGGCTFGGCKDSTQTTTKVNDGAGNIVPITHYEAANYDPNASGCVDASGNPDPNLFDCCVYYGCEDGGPTPIAHNFIDPNSTTQDFWPTNYDGTQTIVGCVAGGVNGANANLVYSLDDSTGNGSMDWTDPLSSWYPSDDQCCNYEGCNDTNGFNTHPLLSDSATAGGSEYGIIGGIDTNNLVNEQISTCEFAGCNQITANNTFTPPAGQTVSLANVGCEMPAQGGGTFIDTEDISCCQFLGCNEPDAYSYWPYNNTGLTSPATNNPVAFAGTVGCSTGSNGNVNQLDDSCCEYIGCKDVNALNAGIHSNNNTDATLGPVIKYDDPSTWDPSIPSNLSNLNCSPDGTPGAIDPTSTCCCTYKEGCADPLATGATPQSNGGAYVPDAGGCGPGGSCSTPYVAGVGQITNEPLCMSVGGTWTPTTPANCTSYTTYTVGGASDIDGNVNIINFPQWQDTNQGNNTVLHAYGELDPNNLICCKYQTGCPDSGEWNPYCMEDPSAPGVWRILDDTMTGFGGTSGWWGTAGNACDGGYGPPNLPMGYGAGYYESGNIGCDMVAPLSQPDSLPGISPVIPDPVADLEPCCTYEPCPVNVCCLAYNTPPIIPPDNPALSEQADVNVSDDNIATNPAGPASPTGGATSTPVLSPAGPVQSSGYTSPYHPIPNHPNPQGGYGWVDILPGHPCHCPNLYDPVSNPLGTIPVNCDDNQPIDPDHPCPLPPPEGCPPLELKFPGSGIPIGPPGVWNPATCKCEYENPIDDDRSSSQGASKCCGNTETGEIVDYATATGQPWPGGSGFAMALQDDNCSNALGSEWMTVRCHTTCEDPDMHTSLNPNFGQRNFECGCRFPQTTTNAQAGDFALWDPSWNIPANTPVPVGTPIGNYDPQPYQVPGNRVGCQITFNHTYTNFPNYVSGAPNNPVPSDTDIEAWDCCVPRFDDYFGCMDPNADNYALNANLPDGSVNAQNLLVNSYGYNTNAIGCPHLISNGIFPDPNNIDCCNYQLNSGCADQLADNYDSQALGCPINSANPNSPIVPFPNPHNAAAAQPSDYNDPVSWSCCDYSSLIGCADPQANNYDPDHYGCDPDGDGLPNGSPFTNATSPDDSCCVIDPCAGCTPQRINYVCSHCLVQPYFDQCCGCCPTINYNWCAGEGTVTAAGDKIYNIAGPPASGFAQPPQVGQDIQLKVASSWNNYAFPYGNTNYGTLVGDMTTQVTSVNNPGGGNLVGGYFKIQPDANQLGNWVNILYWCGGSGGIITGPRPTLKVTRGQDDEELDIDLELGLLDVQPEPESFPVNTRMIPSPSSTDVDSIPTPEVPEVPEVPEKTPEEIEYERKTAEFESNKLELLSNGWLEKDLDRDDYTDDGFEFTSLINQDNERIEFYREIPETPTEPTEPTNTGDVSERKLSKKVLLKIIKNAINEVKSELRNKNK